MSMQIFEKFGLNLWRFWGGVDRGVMFQITPNNGEYTAVNADELEKIGKKFIKAAKKQKKTVRTTI